MKFWKCSIIMISILVLFFSSITVSAETQTDEAGDVYHWKMTDSTWSWEPSVDSRANIDIIELTYTSNGNQLTLSLKVSGNIQASDRIAYIAWVNTSDAYYWLYWMNGQSTSMAINTTEGSTNFDMNPDVNISENNDEIICVFNVVGTDLTNPEFWGYAVEYTNFGDITQEWWGDWIPGTYAPFWGEEGDGNGDGDGEGDTNGDGDVNGDGSDSGTDSDGTPGFGAIALITALAMAIIVLRRRK